MASRIVQRLALAAVLVGALGTGLTQVAVAGRTPGARPPRPTRVRGFNLFAGSAGLTIDANRVQCGMNNTGEQCVNATDSPTLGGGYWPKGSPDQYVFNGGFQIAGIIPDNAGFEWAGDTVGVFFFDASGFVKEGDAVENMYMSTRKDDMDNWPTAAYVSDPTLFDPNLLGRKAASQQDTWTRYWDGNLNLTGGRVHAMGVLVDQRTMAWNFPTGNQDIFYVIMRFINITATDPTRYTGLAAYGYSAADIAEIVRLAGVFHNAVLAKYGVTLPDTGVTFTRVYAGPAEDPDVDPTAATANYSSANLPFAMDFAWISAFNVNGWSFPSDIFFGDFARQVPGFHGLKFLKGPADTLGNQIGVTMFTNTDRLRGLGDRQTTQSLWRLAANVIRQFPVDGQCNTPVNTPLCFVGDAPSDTRMYMFSGPLTINPGESQVVVSAGLFSAAWNPGFVNGNEDGLGHTLGQTTFDVRPGFPGTPTGYVSATSRVGQNGFDTLRVVDRLTGWNSVGPNVSALDVDNSGRIEQDEIPVVAGSLLGKALVAQAVFDAHFLLPYAPDPPDFYLIPGDNQVTVVWQTSLTETPGNGDPYFAVAGNPLNALYDRDYRANDVEGYRIYRGRTQSTMSLIAQFDYAGTSMTDFTAQFNYGAQCAPELFITAGCPADLAAGHPVDLVGDVVQIRPGDRTLLRGGMTIDTIYVRGDTLIARIDTLFGTGDVTITKADTAVTGGASGKPRLTDTGVPFVYTDRTARDGFRYFYAVTAFDVNSVKSGPTSLESSQITKVVTPRVPGSNLTAGTASVQFDILGGDGAVLNPGGTAPTISATTGEFSGPALPTDGLAGLASNFFADQLITAGQSAYIRIDSLVPSYYHSVTYYLSGVGPVNFKATAGPAGDFGVENGDHSFTPFTLSLPANPNLADSLGLGRVPLAGTATTQLTIRPAVYSSALAGWMADVAGSFYSEPTSFDPSGGSRWFTGANEATADPTLNLGAGALPNVTLIYKPTPYHNADAIFRRFYGTNMMVSRAADIRVYWGNTAGKPDSVVDVTHHVPVPWSDAYRASWGIIKDFTNTTLPPSGPVGAPDGIVTYHDFLYGPCLLGSPASVTTQGCAGRTLDSVATLLPVGPNLAGTVDGTGFGMYINGEPFIFQTATLPQNTVWTYRSYNGEVTRTGTTYAFTRTASGPAVPGLRLRAMVTGTPSTYSNTNSGDLTRVHTVPDPYYVTDQLELTSSTKVLRFVNLPSQAIIRIYSVSGILVNLLTHNDVTGGGEEVWNLRNRNNQFVASGVYFYHVETPDGQKKIGRFTVVNFAQ